MSDYPSIPFVLPASFVLPLDPPSHGTTALLYPNKTKPPFSHTDTCTHVQTCSRMQSRTRTVLVVAFHAAESPLHFRHLSLCFHFNLGKVGLWHRSQAEVTQIRQTLRWTVEVLHSAPNWVFNSCVYSVFRQPPLSGLGVTDARELSYNHSA